MRLPNDVARCVSPASCLHAKNCLRATDQGSGNNVIFAEFPGGVYCPGLIPNDRISEK